MKRKSIWIAVGGSGGHIFPAQVCAQELKALDPHLQLVFIGEGLKKNPFFDSSFGSFFDISSSTFSLKTLWRSPQALFKIAKGLKQSRNLIKILQPDVVVGFGSFHSLPPLCAALLQRVPYVLFEPNCTLGRVNRLFAKKASKLFFSLKEQQHTAAEAVKMPLCPLRLEKLSKQEAKAFYGLDPTQPVILIFGGSQGALTMNHLALEALEMLGSQACGLQVLHFTGENTDKELFQKRYAELKITAHVRTFEEKMHRAYSAADVAISRCGASSAMELLEHQIPTIFIPYPFVEEDHQTKNAEFLKKHFGFGDIVHQDKQAVRNLADLLVSYLDPQKLSFCHNIGQNKLPSTKLSEAILQFALKGE
jgi:UDP-N-acetylglucosamine--N-acetylmuramyl-(pentapeptide) pyrophosphoryl-undecaprenol N-acetylglucosamine transferase